MRITSARLAVPPTIRSILSSNSSTPGNSSKQIQISGWIKSLRKHKQVAFAEINDGTGTVQGVLKGPIKDLVNGLGLGSSVTVEGELGTSKGGKGEGLEVSVERLRVLGECDPETYPIQKKHLPAGYLRDHAHLRFRTSQTAAAMRVRDSLMRDWHDWFEENEFVHIHTPILTSSDCEGAGEVFTIQDGGADPVHSMTNPPKQGIHESMQAIISSTPSSSRPIPSSSSKPSSTSIPSTTTPGTTPAQDRFFPLPTNLTVSSQLHLEPPTQALSRTYTLSPCFRAEPSLTSRHLSEFYMLEAEIAWIDNLSDLLDVVEGSIKDTLKRLMWSETTPGSSMILNDTVPTSTGRAVRDTRAARCRDDLHTIMESQADEKAPHGNASGTTGMDFDIRSTRPPLLHLLNATQKPFGRITYSEAVFKLQNQHAEIPFIIPPIWGEGLASEHEKWLAEEEDGPVFVTHYPEGLKPFYMLPSEADSSTPTPSTSSSPVRAEAEAEAGVKRDERKTVACFDLLFPGVGEMAGGSLREHRLDHLLKAMKSKGMEPKSYEWYLDLRRYGSVPHGGWGMGWDRYIAWVTGIGNIRDIVAYPRWKGNCRY